jgi:hypothetical protein
MEAVSVAAQFMNRQDVYSVETATYNQVQAFKVTFSSGDIVYVGLDGQVITTTKLQPVVVNVEPTKKPKKNRSSDNSTNSQPQNNGAQDPHNGDYGGEGGDD